ncbi:MAG: hypothetical protein AB7S26_27510 [Sandaracinaceae bacterium]
MTSRASVLLAFVCATSVGCGARTSLYDEDEPAPRRDGGRVDGGMDAGVDGGRRDAGPIPDGGLDGCFPVSDDCGATELCNAGSDDDCDGLVDEGCACRAGEVQPCFLGPPGRRGVGACQDGEQVCSPDGVWGACVGGILPDPNVCTGRDDLCNGCSADRICPIDCPSPGDPRVAEGRPFEPYPLRGRDFYAGPAQSWRWTIDGGACDRFSPRLQSFTLANGATENAVFVPRLSGDYRVTLAVTVPSGEVLSCSWVIQVAGPGLRVELCYPESESEDLDLYLHRPNDTQRWYIPGGTAFEPIPEASCGWHNCEAEIRLMSHPITGDAVTRADWGYPSSPLSECENGPNGAEFASRVGVCPNPRLDIDNNLSPGRLGLPENINVDTPNDGDSYRIMVHNFTGGVSRPLINVYCGGRRVATFGEAPNEVRNFRGPNAASQLGTMWRVADVTVHVDPSGETTGCDVELLHRPGMTTGFFLTLNDPSY